MGARFAIIVPMDLKQKMVKAGLWLGILAVFLPGCGSSGKAIRESEVLVEDVQEAAQPEPKKNPFSDLSVPTQVNKIGDTYFIVDCYHNEVIYHENMEDPLSEWEVMTDEMDKGHTIAGDGEVFLIDDTENERIMVFEEAQGRYVFSQQFTGIGGRPHYIVYHEPTESFYCWCSTGGRMLVLKREKDSHRVALMEERVIPELEGIYVRSFTILGDEVYFVSGPSSVIRARLADLKILERIPVPEEMAGMVQLTRIGEYYYITISTDAAWNQDAATMIRCRDLSGLMKGEYEDVYSNFIGGGTPYYITQIGEEYYLTEHRIPGHSIWRFTEEDGEIRAETVY